MNDTLKVEAVVNDCGTPGCPGHTSPVMDCDIVAKYVDIDGWH
jgi:hypothetical protein